MAYSRRVLSPLQKDALKAFQNVAENMGNTQERVLMNEASRALQRRDIDLTIHLLKSSLKSLNLTRGEQKVLEGYIKALTPGKFLWLRSIAMKMWPFILTVLHEFGFEIAIAVWSIIHETLSIYWKYYESTKLYTQSACN